MKSERRLHGLLAAVAVLSWGLFILGCYGWPAWSPDGTKVLFPYYNPTAEQRGVALYDLKAQTVKSIFAGHAKDDDDLIVQAQWDRSGHHALVSVAKDNGEHFDIIDFPIGTHEPLRQFTLPQAKGNVPVVPYPESHGSLYILGSSLVRLDLSTGEVHVQQPEKKDEGEQILPMLFGRDDRIYYLIARPTEEQKKAAKSENNEEDFSDQIPLEFGDFDPADMSLHPRFSFSMADLKPKGVTDLIGTPVGPERNSGLFAMVAEHDPGEAIVLFSSSGIERVIVPSLPEGAVLGTLDWAPDGKTIYAAAMYEAGKDVSQCGVAEIPLDARPLRFVPVVRTNYGRNDAESFRAAIQISLSPNGKTIAMDAAAARARVVTIDNRALFLIDLRDPNRHVTRIKAPLTSPPAPPK